MKISCQDKIHFQSKMSNLRSKIQSPNCCPTNQVRNLMPVSKQKVRKAHPMFLIGHWIKIVTKTEMMNPNSHKRVKSPELIRMPHRSHNRSLLSTWLTGIRRAQSAIITVYQPMSSHRNHPEMKNKVKMRLSLHAIWTTWWIGWETGSEFKSPLPLIFCKAITHLETENQTNSHSN